MRYFTNQLVNNLTRTAYVQLLMDLGTEYRFGKRRLGSGTTVWERLGYRFRYQEWALKANVAAIIVMNNPKTASGADSCPS